MPENCQAQPTRTRMVDAQTHIHTYVNHIKEIQILLNIIALEMCAVERVRCVCLYLSNILDELFNMIEVVLKNKYVPIIYILAHI